MGIKKIMENLPTTFNDGSNGSLTNPIKEIISNAGQKTGKKYSDLVDKVVDMLFKRK